MAETISEDLFNNIPTDIITDILARLPPKEVILCRCVCKAWLNLISEPGFVDQHLSKSPTCLIVHQIFPSSPDSATFGLVQVEDETDNHDHRPIAEMDREIPRSRKNVVMTMIGSIDGLVCINEYKSQHDLIYVWNPIMREFITVLTPGGEQQKYPNLITYGFGISSGKYLVVRIYQEIELRESATNSQRILDNTCHVYTIGDGVWKSIGHAPYKFSSRGHGLFFNGNLHWLIYDKDSPDKICCLDLENELFEPFSSPPELIKRHLATLNLYNGCLSVCDNTSELDIVIWVMKKYGAQNSWSKEVVISKQLINLDKNFYVGVYIIKVFECGEILLLWRDDVLFSYHPKRKTVQHIYVKENMKGPGIETRDYVSSIVSLKSLGELKVYRS